MNEDERAAQRLFRLAPPSSQHQRRGNSPQKRRERVMRTILSLTAAIAIDPDGTDVRGVSRRG
ncbi:MAG: hypothetical protein ACOYM5_01870, partial [Caulobacter sp.]